MHTLQNQRKIGGFLGKDGLRERKTDAIKL